LKTENEAEEGQNKKNLLDHVRVAQNLKFLMGYLFYTKFYTSKYSLISYKPLNSNEIS